MPSSHSGLSTISTDSGSTACTSSARYPTVTSTGSRPDPIAPSSAQVSSGRPCHASNGFDTSPPRRLPRPATNTATATLNLIDPVRAAPR